MTVNITVDLAAKSASLDRRVAAGEKITAAFAGLWQDWGAKSCRLRIADADGAATLAEASAPAEGAQGAMAFELDLDTAEAAAATAGRAETPALLLLESIRQDGGRDLLARQQIPLLGWPRAADDTPSALGEAALARIAALEARPDASYALLPPAAVAEDGEIELADHAERCAAAADGVRSLGFVLPPPRADGQPRDCVLDVDNTANSSALELRPAQGDPETPAFAFPAGEDEEEFWKVAAGSAARFLVSETALRVRGNAVIAFARLDLSIVAPAEEVE